MKKRVELAKLSTGDMVYRYDKSIVVHFMGQRKVLSTSVYNGGYQEQLSAVFNHDGTRGPGRRYEVLADTYIEHMKKVATSLDLDCEKVSGMGTAASMENVAIKSMSFKELTVTAIVTGGIEVNGGRVGDPAQYYQPLEKPDRLGTINIILAIDADLPAGILARALVTCTEAKTAALQELMAGSHYSTGIATGSGTDQTMLIANPESSLYLEAAGKHAKLGELIGKSVMAAVKEALERQSGLNPKKQHDMMRRLQRFGISEESCWCCYQRLEGAHSVRKAAFMTELYRLCCRDFLVTAGVMYIHLHDEYSWGLLKKEAVEAAAARLLGDLAEKMKISPVQYPVTITEYMKPLQEILLTGLASELEKQHTRAEAMCS